ncbi:MAG: hypothetical protein IKQ54_11255 [Oscillospiraceae bacterium]|nr:hypothetical protein [Oscillospiraceae bacterium]
MQNAAVPRRLLSALLTVAMLAALLVPGVKAVDGNRYELPTVEPGADARSTGESRIDAPAAANGHDVDMDGDTDNDDVQAILDYLTEKLTAEDVDLSVADLDKDGQITSRDALLLIGWEPEEGPGNSAAAIGARAAAGLGGSPATDGTIALRHRPQRSISGSTGEAGDGQAAVKLIESEEIRNGVLVLVFDKDALSLTGCTSDFAFMSYKETVNGEGKGVVKIAFADKAARKDLAVLKFSYAGETLDTIVKISYLERNEDFAGDGYMEIRLNVTKPLVVPICIVDETDSPALYAWAWGPAGSQDASWPGHALTAAGSDKGGHPWYLIDDLNLSDYNMLILNRGEGQPQSGTLNLLSDLDDGERIIYYIYGLDAEDMRTLYDYVPVADGAEVGTPLSWSVEGYAREARLNEDASLAELNLFNALLHYVDAVDVVDFGS